MGNCLICKNEITRSVNSLNQHPPLTKTRRVVSKPTSGDKSQPNATDYTVALLFVGSSGVGKSTIVKQLQKLASQKSSGILMYDKNWKIQINPFTESECQLQKHTIHRHILKIIGTLIDKSREYGYQLDSFQHQLQADNLALFIGPLDNLHNINNDVEITAETASIIDDLRKDEAIKRTYKLHRLDFFVSDSFEYFMDSGKLTEVGQPGYVPSVEDILRAHDETRDHFEDYNFKIDDAYCTVRDLNGRPDEFSHLPELTREWMYGNKNAKTRFVVYVVSLADYNQKSTYHSTCTKLDESIKLLQVLMSIMLEIKKSDVKDVKQTKLVLLFNKTDVFQTKLAEYNDFDSFVRRCTKQECSEKSHWNCVIDDQYVQQAREYVAKLVFDAIMGSIKSDGAFCCRFLNATNVEDVKSLADTIPKQNTFCLIGDIYE